MIRFYQKNTTAILRLIILLILIWISIGYFPILNIEGDSALFSAGCERIFANGFKLPPDYFYQWDMQPLVGILVVGVKYLVPFFTCEQIYNILTIIFSLGFLLLAAAFISKLSKIRWEYCFFILMLFPETYSIGYYSNTTIFASVFSLLGFFLILKRSLNIYSFILLIVAPLLRVDVIAIYPLVFFLFWKDLSLKKSLFYTGIYSVAILIFMSLGFWLLKANPLNTLTHFNSLDDNKTSINYESFFVVNISFYTIASLFMMVLGALYCLRNKEYKLLGMIFTPLVILYYLNGDFNGSAPKHIQYILPYVAILATFSINIIDKSFQRRKYILSSIILILILSQSLFGIRFYLNSKPWMEKEYAQLHPRPTLLNTDLYKLKKNNSMELVFGAGQIIPTADELMLLSGHFFTPFYWHSVKKDELRERKIIEKLISESNETLYFMTTQSSDWILSQQLHSLGFRILNLKTCKSNKGFESELWFKHDNKKILVTRIILERTPESFNNAYQLIKHRPLYILTQWDWQLYLINEKFTRAEPISKSLSIVR